MNQAEKSMNEIEKPKKLGPCCVCKETKKIGDECFFTKQEAECKVEIQNHNNCLRSFGFEPAKSI